MNHLIWATDGEDPVDDLRARVLRARYYGEITYIDQCLGRVLDALKAAGERENTLICFFSDHGEHLGDHRAWQKESFFEQACRVPFLLSWPGELPAGERRDDLVCLTDLFGIATRAAGDADIRDGIDVLGLVRGDEGVEPREHLVGYHGDPGTRRLTMMVRQGDWKYIYIANGGREQLFDLGADPDELDDQSDDRPEVVDRLRGIAVADLREHDLEAALADDADRLRAFPYERRERESIHQMARWLGVEGFPDDPAAVLEDWELTPLSEFESG